MNLIFNPSNIKYRWPLHVSLFRLYLYRRNPSHISSNVHFIHRRLDKNKKIHWDRDRMEKRLNIAGHRFRLMKVSAQLAHIGEHTWHGSSLTFKKSKISLFTNHQPRLSVPCIHTAHISWNFPLYLFKTNGNPVQIFISLCVN